MLPPKPADIGPRLIPSNIQEDGFDLPAEFRESLVGRMLNVAPDKAAQDRFGLGGAESNGRDVFDHLVVLLANQFPVDRLGQNGP
jgi:hypothetical protein